MITKESLLKQIKEKELIKQKIEETYFGILGQIQLLKEMVNDIDSNTKQNDNL